jgi:putative ABC transport system permease protein
MVSPLDRKLLRELLRMKGQAIAILLLVACGVASYVSSISTYQSLHFSQQDYYLRYRFAQVFAHLERAPESLRSRIEAIDGVAKVDTRVVEDVTLDMEALAEPATGRLVSLPPDGRSPLNDIHIRKGRTFDPDATDEVLVSEGFAKAHGLNPGATVTAVVNGRKQLMRVVGWALSPEYVYAIRQGDLFPDDKRFGVFWMNRDALSPAFDMDGAFNDVSIEVMRGASEEKVIERLDKILEPYGGLGTYGRYQQVSNRYLSDEIQSLEATGVIVPPIFLGVAAFLLNVVLSRLIRTQREQIATLKALGYSSFAVGVHYAKLVLLISVLGVVVGTLLGAWVGRAMTEMYTQFFHFPALRYTLGVDVVVVAALVSVGSAVVGVVSSVKKAVKLPPAEAMRPAAPAKYRKTVIEKLGIHHLLSPAARMIMRNLSRRPVRTLLSSVGIAFALAIVIVGWFFMDSMEHLMKVSFDFAYLDDVTVTFTHPRPERAMREIEHMPGVQYAEPFRVVAAKVRAGHRERQTALFGLPHDARLRRLLDSDFDEHRVPHEGILLTDKLAEVLHVRPGDTLRVELLEGPRTTRDIPVAGVVGEPIGMSAYASLPMTRELMGEESTISGAYLVVDPAHVDELCKSLKSVPFVAGVGMHDAMVQSFEKTSKEYLFFFSIVLVGFAMVIVVGVVYNSGRIALAERERELASLRVMGFTRAEISFILLGELAVQVALSIPLGFALGYGMAAFISSAFDSELYRLPLVIEQSTYVFAVEVLLVSAVGTALVVRRKLDRLDLVEVLKTRE